MEERISEFRQYLKREEKSTATLEKYQRDVRRFLSFLAERPIRKEETVAFKKHLVEHYAPASVNSMLAALNCFLRYCGLRDCCVKPLKIQRQIFCCEEKELTKGEYQRLVKAAQGTKLSYLLQTICGTGIRVSELQHITVEAVTVGKAVVNCKNKTRVIFIPTPLRKLLRYIKKTGRENGPVFVGRNGKPLDRSYIWRLMKGLCEKAKVARDKVYPHKPSSAFIHTIGRSSTKSASTCSGR